ncbi:soluble scavenger receptor cysteine-rich domain-containing protein SSC5D isoform X1 [Apis cerana]|uniref:soluble scavenger receptor cysteine-rich domain-containing protein SSC5D isoform X1 n=1 Tax=Apis cerana TaxID=7461 RepID=UPI002B22332E|nr:soluble scavenger receptor cysteine-rich domain-containing protein SSC5D isoform X1 [Apis cerana]
MSAAVRERTTTHTSRKIVSHGGPISGQSQSTTTANSLENNLDALLEDLQTSVSRSATPSRGGRALSPQVEYRVAANPTKIVSEGRPISPTRTMTTTTEKYVSTGPSGAPSGIPGLDFIDSELQNVQPGQSKTIAYKQVSYQYNKTLDGKPIDSWTVDNALTNTSAAMIDDIRERTYEESTMQRGIEPVGKSVNRELVYNDSSTSRSKQTSPLPAAQRDVKYIHAESSSERYPGYQTEPVQQNTVTTVHKTTAAQEYGNVEYIPVPSPTPAVPINLAPGPNTKVTTTIKTYTYELPGPPETYLPGGNVPGTVVLPGDQTITYTIPKGTTSTADKTITYQTVTENVPSKSPARYSSPPPPVTDVTKKSTTIHQESKFYREEHHGGRPSHPTTTSYHPGSPPPIENKTTITRNEKYYQVDGTYPNGYPAGDHPGTTVIYQNQPPNVSETHTTINRVEEHYPSRPPSSGRHPTPDKPGTPVNYYTSPPQSSAQPQSTTIYKLSNTTTTIPPNKNPEDHEVLLPKPFPVEDVRAKPVNNVQTPPKKLEDLMASFSDTEREVLEDIEKREKEQQKDSPAVKKEVDFVPHTPPKVKSKNVAGPPVYYPPGAAEFTKKEECNAAMSQAGGGWAKAKGKYEYEASSKSKTKSSSGKAVVPVCLPLCCALPCVIM